ncbi:Geranylgeranyl transferase type-2 subunit alpha [Gracilariopsis chorda]|uniref:Geranylgeranyl transferase type-2 subunit alpha n=1 Tax=Gracilariopsis chorda TaxID=448386 RepID=A0A2V3IP06_9FLOR|nr:Geranylgeranyl transferase type-2 subunit alpha [Gracilariopsis chorda]|eukprot:PXF43821.1 Geranylgeranyl transferase type-2 subunit alpha [Gracilariopsis chorda]
MHGRRKGTRPSGVELQEELQQGAAAAELIRKALQLRKQTLIYPLDTSFREKYLVVERALETNPDEYTLWAFRREVFLLRCEHDSPETVLSLWKEELFLTTRALQRHPKAYPAWQHRLWLLEDAEVANHIPSEARLEAIKSEQKLSQYMLFKDGRNFHGWAHRMRVKSVLISVLPEHESQLEREELAFVEEKINDDFSNYSAWHHRSVLLPKVHDQSSEVFLTEELDYVRQAFYTEPNVQSAWFYHRWLLAGAPARRMKAHVQTRLLEDELMACNELLEIEPEAKYALQTKAQLLLQLKRGMEAEAVIDDLERMDPMRKGYYRYLRGQCHISYQA